MAVWVKRGQKTVQYWGAAALLGALISVGCSKQPASPEQASGTPVDTPAIADKEGSKPAVSENKGDTASPPVRQDDKLEPFAKVTRTGDDPPANSNPPPDVTVSGKPVYKIYKEVLALWDSIHFVTDEGKPIHYSATIETDFGNIEIALRPDLAPNHVRNFVALARAGYYDELFIDRICHEETEVEPGKMQVFDSIEAGCPLGNGDPGNGSIGYWLKPELSAKAAHEPGTVGACHGPEIDSAACRFYVVYQCKTKALDGNYTVFGKVTEGLDAARKIFLRKSVAEDANSAVRRPEKPVVIRSVKIEVREAS